MDNLDHLLPDFNLEHVSHSQVSMWEKCPRQWEYAKVKRIKYAVTTDLVEGRCYHATIEENFRQKIKLGFDLDFDILYDVFCSEWDKCLREDADINWRGKDPSNVKDEGIELVGKYMEDVAPLVMPIEVEKEYITKIAGVRFILRLDLMDINGAVIDHKTSGRAYTQEDVDKDMQASATAFALGRPIIFYNHVALKIHSPRIQIVRTVRTFEDIEWWKHKVTAIVAHMKTGLAPPRENGWWCSPSYCGYWDICRSELTGGVSQ